MPAAGSSAELLATLMLLPLTNAQRVQRFGRFRFVPAPKPSNPEAIRILGGWSEANITEVRCPQLAAKFGRQVVNLNHKAAPSFLALWQAWDDAGLLDIVTSWNGSWVPRYKRGRAGGGEAALSNHSWGNAFDVCAREWPLGRVVPANAPIRALVPHAEALGWFWGGAFRSRVDAMHFEYVGITPGPGPREAARRLLYERLTPAEKREAQRAIGVTADGIVGPKTLARAREVLGP